MAYKELPALPGKKAKIPWQVHIERFLLQIVHPPAEECTIDECRRCAVRDCPSACDQHYWKDGCPFCWSWDTYGYRTNYLKQEADKKYKFAAQVDIVPCLVCGTRGWEKINNAIVVCEACKGVGHINTLLEGKQDVPPPGSTE